MQHPFPLKEKIQMSTEALAAAATGAENLLDVFKPVSFPVDLMDIAHPTKMGKIPNRKAIVRTDTDEVLNIVSNRYPLVRHIDVFGKMEEAIHLLGLPVMRRQVQSAYSGGYAKVVWTLDRTMEVYGHGIDDKLKVNITARNSYNYSSLVGLEFGTYRLICSNGASVGQLIASARKRHVPSLNVSVLVGEIAQMVSLSEEVATRYRAWANIEYTRERFIQWLEKKPLSREGRQAVTDYFTTQPDRARVGAAPAYTGWEAYNSLTWFATHRVRSRNSDTLLVASERVQDLAQAFSRSELETTINTRRN
jgi:hypothetical protein